MPRHLLTLLSLVALPGVFAADHLAYLGTYTRDGSRGIYTVRLDAATGALSTPVLAAETPNPGFLALHPNGRVLYALSESGTVNGKPGGGIASFRLDPATGHLTPLNLQPTGGIPTTHLVVDATGRMLVTASYGGGYVTAFPLEADGRLAPHTATFTTTGVLGPNPARQDKPHPHSVTLSPDNRLVCVADIGLDRVFAYQLDPAAGALAPATPPTTTVAPGTGPRHSKFSADGKFFYVVGELDATVTTFAFDAAHAAFTPVQRISALPADFKGPNTAAEIRVSPDGRFVYTSNRGHDSLAVFARDATHGTLTPVEIVPSGGKVPRNFSLTPDGAWLLCAHQDSDNLTVFRVDPSTGRLTATPHTAKVPKAICVLFVN